jgi:hypothetical protein
LGFLNRKKVSCWKFEPKNLEDIQIMNTTGASVVQHQQDLLQQPQQPATVTTNKDKRVAPIPIPLDREQLKLLLLVSTRLVNPSFLSFCFSI